MTPTASRARSGTSLELRLLGPFEALVDGLPVAIAGSKRRAVLAVLALSPGRVVSFDTLMEVLWRVDEPAAPRNAVQHHVMRLRAELGHEAIEAHPNGYALAPARVDALVLESLLTRARRALRTGDPQTAESALVEALGLFRGPPLQGLPDTDWVCAEAARLEDIRLDALEEHFEAELALGEHAEITSAIRAAVESSPFRERLHGQLMLALYRSGRQADALEAFQQARRVLSEQLGLEPGPELRRLERAILAHEPDIELTGGRAPLEDAFAGPSPQLQGAAGVADALRLMRAYLRRAEELYDQAVAAAAAPG
jgi:DNA-binding SARP family transcriptional activator